MENKQIMLEVFEVFGPDDIFKIYMDRNFAMNNRVYIHGDLRIPENDGFGYDIKILNKDLIVHNNNILKKMKFFVKAKLCTLKKFKEVMKECGLYNNGQDVNVEHLKEIGMVGVIVRDENNIPLYFCVHRDLIREHKKISKKQSLKFAA